MPAPRLSTRAVQHRDGNSLSTIKLGKYYHKVHNPNGVIVLSVAENSLMSKELMEYMTSHFHLTPAHLKYRGSLVSGFEHHTSKALPGYFNTYFKPHRKVLPKHVVAGNGLGSLLAQLVYAVCDEGDGILLPTPYYGDYPRDIVYPGRAVVVAGHIPATVDPLSVESIPYVRSAIVNSQLKGTNVKMLVICNPHNPLARAYPKETLVQYALLAEELDLHFLVDEVYALQVFPTSLVPHPEPFVSVLSFDFQTLGVDPSRVHVLAGPTKDFGASGMKVGALISQHNPAVVEFIEDTARANPMSSASDALFTQILEDDVFREWFLDENRKRLSRAFERAAGWCTFHKLPFLPANAGVFFLVDFAPLLDRSFPGIAGLERLLAAVRAMLKAGIFMRPSNNSEDPIHTRFRMTFTLPEDVMNLAFERLERAFDLPPWDGVLALPSRM